MKLEAFFKPRSIAVIGASRDPEKVGHRVFQNLVDSGFRGGLYPVNPKGDEILGFKCYSSVLDISGEVELAIVAVPAAIVPNIAEQCGVKGVSGMVVISAGFSETGRKGAELEKELLDTCRKHGVRMQGPNCLGLINTQSRMNGSFASTQPTAGNVAFLSQSGAVGSAIMNWALQNDVGFTSFISLGNEADLNASDFLEALAEDERTRAVGLYIEGVKNGGQFIKAAEALSRKKPLVALKAGTTDVGVRAVSSHTGSLAGSDTAFSAAFKKTGILRVDTLEEMFNLVLAFEDQPLPKGRNMLIVTNGGGPAILTADACEKNGLELPLLEYELREKLRNSLPPHASVNNPVDVLGDADQTRYELAVKTGLESRNIDGVIVILTPQAMTPCTEIAEVVAEARKSSDKPVVAVFMGLDNNSSAIKILQKNNIPNYVFPESTALVLKKMYDYGVTLKAPSETVTVFSDTDDKAVDKVLRVVRNENRLNPTIKESFQIAKAYGVSVPEARIARSRREAGKIADMLGYPVVMKVVSPEILHKTDFGGVVLNISSRDEAERHYDSILAKTSRLMPQARIFGVLVHKMVPQGKEVIIGSVRDIQFGPLMMFGLGGIYVNFLRDVSYRLCPLTKSEAREMIEETKAYTLLRGVRGEPPSDIELVVDVILRVSQVMNRFKEIVEMEINPLFVYGEGKGCTAVDIRMTIKK